MTVFQRILKVKSLIDYQSFLPESYKKGRYLFIQTFTKSGLICCNSCRCKNRSFLLPRFPGFPTTRIIISGFDENQSQEGKLPGDLQTLKTMPEKRKIIR